LDGKTTVKSKDKEFVDVLKHVLGRYGMTPLVACAIRFFLRNPYESLVIVNKEGRFEYMDRGSEKLFGLTPGGAKGILVTNLIKDSLLPRVLETQTPIIGGVFNVRNQRKVGSVYPLVRDGELVGGMGRLILHSLDELERINRQVGSLKKQVRSMREREIQQHRAHYTFKKILGVSANIRDCIALAKKAAMTETDVLIVGESGTGKEIFAQAIHNFINPDRPFVSVNSPAIPRDLAESELFGYKKGAFSGATSEGKQGKFELANNGTLFLDEISSLPLSIQAKLLRVLEEREIQALGDTITKKINFHLISATNVDLKKLVDA
jgi:transcriptional regulator with PAS, ATPase and Fis domain